MTFQMTLILMTIKPLIEMLLSNYCLVVERNTASITKCSLTQQPGTGRLFLIRSLKEIKNVYKIHRNLGNVFEMFVLEMSSS